MTRAGAKTSPEATRLATILETFDACESAKRHGGGMGLELQVADQRVLAAGIGVPYLAVVLMYSDQTVTVADLRAYQQWQGRSILERLLSEREADVVEEG